MQEWANLFMMVVVTGLGGAKLLEMWQAHRLKTAEKRLEHDMAKEDKAVDYIIQQAENYRKQLDDIQNNKLNLLIDSQSKCAEVNVKLDEDRAELKALTQKVLQTIQTQNEALKFVIERMRFDKSKSDTSGRYADIMDALSDIGSRNTKISTGEWHRNGNGNE